MITMPFNDPGTHKAGMSLGKDSEFNFEYAELEIIMVYTGGNF